MAAPSHETHFSRFVGQKDRVSVGAREESVTGNDFSVTSGVCETQEEEQIVV